MTYALSNVTEASNNSDLSSKHDIGGCLVREALDNRKGFGVEDEDPGALPLVWASAFVRLGREGCQEC